mmetsp:Transcript_31070/g.91234  ORF Transcript_31070/g.91234 Transcript_31070/m.91234 type:complete len:291 (-) Transcript_31070:360-1232(-)
MDDPHIRGAHGDTADFKGKHHAVYNALSARNLSVNLLLEHANFRTPHSKLTVHGSWVRAAFLTVRTARRGRLIQVFFHSSDPHRAIMTEGCTAPYCRDGRENSSSRLVLAEGGRPLVVENVRVVLSRKTLTLTDGRWRAVSRSTNAAPHWGQLRMQVEVTPTYAVDRDPVPPHGLLGQTFDRDRLRVDGRTDSYEFLTDGTPASSRTAAGGDVLTRAMAEGALEGHADDYRMASDFAVGFRFSRFDATAARTRNVSALGGAIGSRLSRRPAARSFTHDARAVFHLLASDD